MIKINKSDILNEFYTLFPNTEKDARTFSVAADLTVLNNGFEYSHMPFYSLPLSIMTYITVKVTNDDIFKVRFSDSDKEYICSSNELNSYNKDNELKDIFNALAASRQSISGACILFSYDSSFGAFKNNVAAIFLAFSIINSKTLPPQESIFENSDKNALKSNRNCLIFGRKNCLVSSDTKAEIEYYPFDLQNKKIILSAFGEKTLTLKKSLLEAISDNNISQNFYETGTFISDNTKKYVLNEKERTYSYINNLSDKEILKKSPYELSEFLKNTSNIEKMLDTSYFTSFSMLSFISLKYSSLVSVVDDENVDSFINKFRTDGEKIIGRELKFYIADSKDSGIELF